MKLFSPMLQRIVPIFNKELGLAEKVIEKYREESSKQEMLNLMIMNNKPYTFMNRTQDMYLGKLIRDCMKTVSKI